MHRFFCPHSDFAEEIVEITAPQEIHHLKDVLRLKPQKKIRLFNAQGQEMAGTILTIHPQKVEVRRDYVLPPVEERTVDVILACAVPKRAKFEFIIEKSTELGVDEIIPLKTHRTEIPANPQFLKKKNDRYQTTAVNAAKQSGRARVPRILPIATLPEFFQRFDDQSLRCIASLSNRRENLLEIFQKQNFKHLKRVVFLIGPEGDFTLEEIADALKAGFIPVSLGNNVLKVDTAALCAVSFATLFLDYALKR